MKNTIGLIKAILFYLLCFVYVVVDFVSLSGFFRLVAAPLFLLDKSPTKIGWGSLTWYSYDQYMATQMAWLLNWWFKPKENLFGHPDETISSVLAKEWKNDNPTAYWTMKILNKVDENHDLKAIEPDEGFKRGQEKEM